MSPQNLLLVSQDLGIGGLERVVSTIARNVRADRFTVRCLCLRELGPFGEALRTSGIPVDVLPWQAGQPDYFSFVRVAGLLRTHRIDIVHSHNTDAFIAAGLGRLLSGRRVRHVHTDHARAFPDKWRYVFAERLLSMQTVGVVGVSPDTTEALARHVRIARHRLVTIPNGIDAPSYNPVIRRVAAREELSLPLDAHVVGVGSRLTKQKGVDVLLRAWAMVHPHAEHAMLVIAGDGEETDSLRALATDLGVAPTVRFLGPRQDLVELLPAFDIFCMPSRWEGLPMAMLEAMAARVPLVASAVGGIPQVLSDAVHAVLVPPEDPAALGRALLDTLADREGRESRAQNAYAVFQKEYSADVMVRRYELLYTGAVA